jgi:hypothetical protein
MKMQKVLKTIGLVAAFGIIWLIANGMAVNAYGVELQTMEFGIMYWVCITTPLMAIFGILIWKVWRTQNKQGEKR